MIKRIMQWTSLVKRQIISAVYVYTECNKKTLQYLEVNKKKKSYKLIIYFYRIDVHIIWYFLVDFQNDITEKMMTIKFYYSYHIIFYYLYHILFSTIPIYSIIYI